MQKKIKLYIDKKAEVFQLMVSGNGMEDLRNEAAISDATLNMINQNLEKISADLYHHSLRRGGEESDDRASPLTQYPISDKLKNVGDLIFTLFLSTDIRNYLSNLDNCSITISSNDFSIPWELMYDGKQFLCLKYPISRKVQIFHTPTKKNRTIDPDNIKVLLIGDPTETLPEAVREVNNIVKILKAEIPELSIRSMVGKNIDRFDLLESICNYDILHFAGHGKYNSEYPEKSFLTLHDGPLYTGELVNRLSVNPPVIAFINACETSKLGNWQQYLYEKKMVGIANSFISAGVRCFIGASWPIHDVAATHFAVELYKNLAWGDDVGLSALKARNSIFEKFSKNEISWASFILFGDPDLKIALGKRAIANKQQLTSIFTNTLNWLLEMKRRHGIWCDNIYKQQGIINTCEILEVMLGLPDKLDMALLETSLEFVLNETDEKGFIPSPYFEQVLQVDFNTAVVLVMYELAKARRYVTRQDLKERIDSKIIECIHWLLENQYSDGGWAWGKRHTDIPAYTYYTSNSIYYLINTLKILPQQREMSAEIGCAIKKGLNWFYKTQCADGGWGMTMKSQNSDLLSTGYALESIGLDSNFINSDARYKSLQFIKSNLTLQNIDELIFETEMPIIIAGKNEEEWPYDEDYGGKSSVLNGLLSCWENGEIDPEVKSLIYMLSENILKSKDPHRGWPKIYSTIYATSYNIHVLSRLSQILSTKDRIYNAEVHQQRF